ncbi:MAG: tetratricopeptide repeat protein [Desulfobacterales bacterium]|nr:tetratricopeptide repeat protein [Desulfobacterales bacterium]MBF0399041.1 tetratricopeptide repeat protein [Desulfobacterales bacterium]
MINIIGDDLLESFKEFISSNTGISIRKQDTDNFKKILSERIKLLNLESPNKYYDLLINSYDGRVEIRNLSNLLTTGESYFFRDKGQISTLKNFILPEIFKKKEKEKRIRILSAGCSTGEEPYSIAILITKLIANLYDWKINIIGIDINENSIERAKKATYTDWSFRMVEPDLKIGYFSQKNDKWILDDKIRNMVNFFTINLIADTLPNYSIQLCDFDIILCRNVFIYFNNNSIAIVLKKLLNTLNEEGYLITGHGELYAQNLSHLKPLVLSDSVIYRKVTDPITVPPKAEKPQEIEKKGKPIYPKTKEIKKEDKPFTTPNNLDTYMTMAKSYANSSDYNKAIEACRKAIEVNSNFAEPYFLLAHIAEDLGNKEEAKNYFKKVIYLSPKFIAAYVELGALYNLEKDIIRAKKMYSTAKELLMDVPRETFIDGYETMTAGELLEYLKQY